MHGKGIPRVLLEASLVELPIVSSDMPGSCEVIHHGITGYVVPKNSPEPLAARVLDMLRDRDSAIDLARNGAENVRRTYGLRTIVRQHVELYRSSLPLGSGATSPSDLSARYH